MENQIICLLGNPYIWKYTQHIYKNCKKLFYVSYSKINYMLIPFLDYRIYTELKPELSDKENREETDLENMKIIGREMIDTYYKSTVKDIIFRSFSYLTDRMKLISSLYLKIDNTFIELSKYNYKQYIYNLLFPNTINCFEFSHITKEKNKLEESKDFSEKNKLDISSRDFSEKNIICIPSVINTSNNSIYNQPRSIFSPKERLEQTIKQIKSIRKFIPHSYIILCELNSLDLDMICRLGCFVDKLIIFDTDEKAQYLGNFIQNKGICELYVIQFILEKLKDVSFSHFFKFGGRYKLLQNMSNFLNDKPTFRIIRKENGQNMKSDWIDPIIYSLPKKYTEEYRLKLVSHIFENNPLSIENIIYNILDEKETIFLDNIYVEGITALGKYHKI